MTTDQINLLSKGLKFIQTPVLEDNHIRQQLLLDFKQFVRPMRLQYIFHNKESEQHPFHVKSNWEPPVQQSVALKTYLEEVKVQHAEIQLIIHLCDDITHAVHYGYSSKDRKSLKKMVATDAKSHGNKDIQGHSKPENFKMRIVLTEDNVPGPSFKNQDPQIFHNELKHWLKCRGGSVGGSRGELLARFVVLSVFFCQHFKN